MSYINRTQLYIELIQEIINSNKDIFSIDFIQHGLAGLIEDNPILSKLSIDDDFQINSQLPDFEGSLDALKTFVNFLHFYIQKLIPEKDVEDRFVNIGESFIQEHSIEILETDLMAHFSSIFFEEKNNEDRMDISSLRKEPAKKQIVIIFETLFTVYLQEAFKTDDRGLFFSEVIKLKKSFPILTQFLITQSGDVTIVPKDEDTSEVLVENLAEVFDYFVDFSSPSLGSDMAFKRAREIITPIIDLLEDLPEKNGILNYILKGAMAKRIPTGISGFDPMIQGGIPRGKAVLIQASPGSEKNFFISHVIKNGLEHNSNFIMVLGKIPPHIFKVQLKTLGLRTTAYEKVNRLKIIDWYSWRNNDKDKDNNKVTSDSVIEVGGELSKLWMAIDGTLTKLSYSPTKCVVINILTSALGIYEFDQVFNFLQEIIEKFKKDGITTLYMVEKEAHDPMILAKLRVLFDGVIDIDNEEVDGKINRKIRVLFMRETEFDPEFKSLTLKGTKLIVSET